MPEVDFDTLDLPPTGTQPVGIPGATRQGGARNRQAPRQPIPRPSQARGLRRSRRLRRSLKDVSRQRLQCWQMRDQAGAARAVQVKLPASGSSRATARATCWPSASALLTVSAGSTQPSISTRRVRPVHRARACA